MSRLDRIWVAFVEPESPGNIGFLARVMENFGLAKMILVGGCPPGDDTWTYAMHAKDVVRNARHLTWDELMGMPFDFLIGTSSRQGHDTSLPRVAIGVDQLGRALGGVDGEICVVLGREGNGLSIGELERCDIVVNIPTSPGYPALNVTHAAAVIFYEIFRHQRRRPPARMRKADAREKEILLRYVDVLVDSTDLPDHRKRWSRLVFRRLIGRAFISGRECHTLIGLMKALVRAEDG